MGMAGLKFSIYLDEPYESKEIRIWCGTVVTSKSLTIKMNIIYYFNSVAGRNRNHVRNDFVFKHGGDGGFG